MAKNTALGAERNRKLSLRTKNMKNFIIPIFLNALISIQIIKHLFIVWDYQKIPDEMQIGFMTSRQDL